jgi:hypothetical protein
MGKVAVQQGQRIEKNGSTLCLGLLGALSSCTTWSTLHLQASHVGLLPRSSGAIANLSRWAHVL